MSTTSPFAIDGHPLDEVCLAEVCGRVHGYWSVDLDVLVTTAQEDLPDPLAAVRSMDRNI